MTRIAVLVNGGISSAAGLRAQRLLGSLGSDFQVRFLYRRMPRPVGVTFFLVHLWFWRPRVCYLMDLGISGGISVALYRRLRPVRLIVDTGDAVAGLTSFLGGSWPARALTRWLERWAFKTADQIVVRGPVHQKLLQDGGVRNVQVIPDGVDTERFRPSDVSDLRTKYRLNGALMVGLQGNFTWNRRLRWGLGHELLEALAFLRDLPIKGILIGEGPGYRRLKKRARALGLEDRILWMGRVRYEELPPLLNLIDICLITQTNEPTSWVRTTGKLPCYMACGRYILASRVGTPTLVLPEEMLVDYEGPYDQTYPKRLADRIRSLLRQRNRLNAGRFLVAVAKEHFDYPHLARQAARMVERLTLETLGEPYV